MKPTILISACLMGINCRYDGTTKTIPELSCLTDYFLVPFCPETMGGLIVPRLPAEIQNGDGFGVLSGSAKVINQQGLDLSAEFIRGAYCSLELAKLKQPEIIVVKSKSPSCGTIEVYDGSFSGVLKAGAGVTTALLRQAGFMVYSELEFMNALDHILGKNKG